MCRSDSKQKPKSARSGRNKGKKINLKEDSSEGSDEEMEVDEKDKEKKEDEDDNEEKDGKTESETDDKLSLIHI